MWNYYDSFPAKSNITSVNEKMDLKPEHNIITGLKSVDLKGKLSFIKILNSKIEYSLSVASLKKKSTMDHISKITTCNIFKAPGIQ